MCDRWLGEHGFANFLADMGERPAGKTLDRYPNKDGDYEQTNCRWATWVEQNRNRRDTKLTRDIADEIIARLKAGDKQRSIAVAFNVSQRLVWNIKHGIAWAAEGR